MPVMPSAAIVPSILALPLADVIVNVLAVVGAVNHSMSPAGSGSASDT